MSFRYTFVHLFTICLQIRLFFMQKAAIKVKYRDSGVSFDFFRGNIYLADLLYHNLFKLSTVWEFFGSLHKR